MQWNALLIQHCYIPYGTTQLKKTTKNKQKGPFWGPRRYSEGNGLPEGARYQVKLCGEHETNPGGPIRGSWGQIWSPGARRGPQKGHFGPKRALLGLPGGQKGPDTRSKCVVIMSPSQTGQSGAVGTKFGPTGPFEDLRGLKRAIRAKNEPFWGPQECRRGPLRGPSA